jgi:hypothetical protein
MPHDLGRRSRTVGLRLSGQVQTITQGNVPGGAIRLWGPSRMLNCCRSISPEDMPAYPVMILANHSSSLQQRSTHVSICKVIYLSASRLPPCSVRLMMFPHGARKASSQRQRDAERRVAT